MSKSLPFHPHAGTVLVADFRGFVAPELTKKRPVIVISPRLPFRSGLATIVPISTTAPLKDVPYVHRLSRNYSPWGEPSQATWAKCDLVMNVGFARLSAFKVDRRKYITPRLTPEDLAGVREAVLHGLGWIGH
ncbi:type II toxin-antitoxin system PemK/MazF family toxin [Maritalea mobilis]|uniref:type II toxin-antitoxin system PemK/MazF family toxin n=1 Tax=Maritalea mobilis TaxID=483324 RepID=UPI001C95F6B1|nr:type II toxin-antitoxin system PemK/MazF family toxin [Maritalea mobilis]MBY6201896.1 type II toxin-antitoxin system PemK/MazF family toxin [Maritalea mobilis]